MMVLDRSDDVTLTGAHPDGFMVVHVQREAGYFSVTGEVYASERAYELGNSGAIHSAGALGEEAVKLFPDLAAVEALHLSDVRTGEPMHAVANGWYRLSGRDMQHDLQGRTRPYGGPNYYQAPDPFEGLDERGELNPAYIDYFRTVTARGLRCTVEELPDVETEDEFVEWVDRVMRPRWKAEADQANAWIDAHENDVHVPAEQDSEEEYTVELDDGLRLSARLMDEPGERNGQPHFQYAVVVEANGHKHDSVFGGSIADYSEGTRNAREAAFGTARELLSFSRYDSAEDYADELEEGWWAELTDEQRAEWNRTHENASALEDALLANEHLLGS